MAFAILCLWVLLALCSGWIETYVLGWSADELIGSTSAYLSPMSYTEDRIHLLGTDGLGRDVAAGMVNGARVSFVICTVTLLLAGAIGLFIGMVVGYYGNKKLKANLPQVAVFLLSLVLGVYYFMDLLRSGWSWWSSIMLVAALTLAYVVVNILSRVPLGKMNIPMDLFMQRIIETKESLPNLFLILAISSLIAVPSIWTLAFTISLLYWVTFTRFARAEMYVIREEDYITAARSQGVSDWNLLWKHAFPNILPSIILVGIISMSGVILLESSLSFLGIGLPVGEVTWGNLLAGSRASLKAWWLAVFPGLAIFAILFSLNTLSDFYRSK